MGVSNQYTALVQVKVSDVSLKSQLNNIKIKPLTLKVRIDSQDTKVQLNQISGSSEQLGSKVKTASKEINGMGNSLKTASKHTKNLGKDFIDTFGKVAKFGAITAILGAFTGAIGHSYKTVKDFDDSLIGLRKVSDLSGESLDRYTKKLGDLGDAVYRTRTEMTKSATVFKQANYSDNDAAKLAQVAELYRNVADEEITSAEAGAYLISQMKAFNITAEDSISIIDKTNKLGNEFAVSTSDISTALTKTASTFATYGNDINETMGMVVAATELIPKGAGKVSKGLSSIGAEIVKLANETGTLSYEVGNTVKTMSLFDKSGEILNTFNVLKEIKTDWDNMSHAQQSAIALSLGMKTQIPVFAAEMNNFDVAIKAVEASLNSQGSAMEENEKRADSISTKLKMLQKSFEDLVLGDGGISTLIKGFLDFSIVALKFADSDAVKLIAVLSSMVAISVLSDKAYKSLSTSFLKVGADAFYAQKGMTVLTLSQMGATASTVSFGTALKALTVAWATSPFGMATIAIGVIGGLASVIDSFTTSTDEAEQALEEFSSSYKTSTTEVARLKTELSGIETKISEINSIDGTKVVKDGELEKLIAQRTELEKSLAVQIKIQENARIESEKSAKQVLSDKVAPSEIQFDETGQGIYAVTLVENLDLLIKKYEELIITQNDLDASDKNFAKNSEKLKEEINSVKVEANSYSNQLQEAVDSLSSTDDATQKLKSTNQKSVDAWNSVSGASAEASSQLENISDIEEGAISTAEEIANTYSELGDSLGNLSSAYSTLESAAFEYNDTGALSLDTLSSLLSLNGEYLSALEMVDGQLVINEEALYNLAEQKKIDAIISLQSAAASDMFAYANGEVNKMSLGAQSAVSGLGGNISDAGKKAATAQGEMLGFASSVAAAYTALGGKPGNLSEGQDAILASYTDIIKKIAGMKIDFSTVGGGGGGRRGGGGGGGAKSAAKQATDIWKEEFTKQLANLDHLHEMELVSDENYFKQLQELNEKYFGEASGKHSEYLSDYQKNEEKIYKGLKKAREDDLKDMADKYKSAFSYLNKSIDREINEIQRRREDELDDIDEEIDSLEELSNKYLDSANDKIEALDKQKEAEEKYWDDKINALKNANSLIEHQMELEKLQEALAKAKTSKVKIFKDGRFVYGENETAISEAEQNLYDYNRQEQFKKEVENLEKLKDDALNSLESQIKGWEDYKDNIKNKYDDLITNLEKYREETEADYNRQIRNMEEYQDDYNELVNSYENNQERLLYLQVFGADAEAQTWSQRIKTLREKIKEYNEIQAELNPNHIEEPSIKDEKPSKPKPSGPASDPDLINPKPKPKPSGPASDPDLINKGKKIKSYSGGISEIKDDEFSIVGENPNKEIVIGSKLNQNGVMMNLRGGSGVVDAHSTNTLASMLKGVGMANLNSPSLINENTKSDLTDIHIANLNVSANNVDEFVQSMKQFKVNIKQKAFI